MGRDRRGARNRRCHGDHSSGRAQWVLTRQNRQHSPAQRRRTAHAAADALAICHAQANSHRAANACRDDRTADDRSHATFSRTRRPAPANPLVAAGLLRGAGPYLHNSGSAKQPTDQPIRDCSDLPSHPGHDHHRGPISKRSPSGSAVRPAPDPIAPRLRHPERSGATHQPHSCLASPGKPKIQEPLYDDTPVR